MKRWLPSLVLAGTFVTMCAIVVPVDHPVELDHTVATWIAANRSDALVTVAHVASWLGSVVALVPLGLTIAWYVQRRHGWRTVGWFAAATLGGTALYLAFNTAFARERPPMGIRLAADTAWSFPSGHSTQAMVFWPAVAIVMTLDRGPRARGLGLAGAIAMILAIGSSRICLGAHWTTDVLGGFALGACWLATLLAWRHWRRPTVL